MRDAELGINDINAERGAFDQFGKCLLAPADRFLGPLALGDVLRRIAMSPPIGTTTKRNHVVFG